MEKTEKKAVKNLNLKTKLKAGLLAAVALIPSGACGKNVGYVEPGASTSIETETNTENNTNTIKTTTKANKTTTNTFVTEATNSNSGYVDNTTNNNSGYVDNTANNNTNSTEAKTENKTNPTTHQNTTQSTNKTTTIIKNSDIKVTTTTKANTQKPTTQKPVQTTAKQTTQKPVVTTTAKVTQPPVTTVPYNRRNYNIEDIRNDDAAAAYWAMQRYAEQLSKELFNGYYFDTQYGRSDGFDECFALIGTLNYNQGINQRAFGNRFGCESEDYFLRCTDCLDLAYYQYDCGSKVDFNKYVLDKDFANFLNRVSDEFVEYMNGNTEPLTDEINNYFANNAEYIDNYAKYYFMCNTAHPENYYCDEMNEARQIFNDNVTYKMRDDFMQYGGKLR